MVALLFLCTCSNHTSVILRTRLIISSPSSSTRSSSRSTSNHILFGPCLKNRWHRTPLTYGKSFSFLSILSCLSTRDSCPLCCGFSYPCTERQCSWIPCRCRLIYGHFLHLIPSVLASSNAEMALVVGRGNWNVPKPFSLWIILGMWLNSAMIRRLSSGATSWCFLPVKWLLIPSILIPTLHAATLFRTF